MKKNMKMTGGEGQKKEGGLDKMGGVWYNRFYHKSTSSCEAAHRWQMTLSPFQAKGHFYCQSEANLQREFVPQGNKKFCYDINHNFTSFLADLLLKRRENPSAGTTRRFMIKDVNVKEVWYNRDIVGDNKVSMRYAHLKVKLANFLKPENGYFYYFCVKNKLKKNLVQHKESKPCVLHKFSFLRWTDLPTLLSPKKTLLNILYQIVYAKELQNPDIWRAILAIWVVVGVMGVVKIPQVQAATEVTKLSFKVQSSAELVPVGWEVALYNKTTAANVKTVSLPVAAAENDTVTIDLGAASNYTNDQIYQMKIREQYVLTGTNSAGAGDDQLTAWTQWQTILVNASEPVQWCANIAGDYLYVPVSANSCNNAPEQPTQPNAENAQAPTIGAFASYVTGFSTLTLSGSAKDVDVGQNLIVQYQIDATAGTWYDVANLTADASNQNWSANVNLGDHYPALAAGSHTIYVRVYDGVDYSTNRSVDFVLDSQAPSNTVTLIGGVRCSGDNTVFCSAPTGIDLASGNADNAAGMDAYRYQWDTFFATASATPAWQTGAMPSNLSVSGHDSVATEYNFYYQTRDKVGNVSAVKSLSYYINSAPTLTLDNAADDHMVTNFTPLILSGKLTDLDIGQTVQVTVRIDGVDYQSQTYQTLGGEQVWSLIVNASSLQGLDASELTNLPVTVTDSVGSSSTTYYTGQITVSANAKAEIYLSVMKNEPFALTIGKVGAFNITYGTSNGVTVAVGGNDEIVVSGTVSESMTVNFGVTALIFTALDGADMAIEEVEFI